MTHLKMLRWLNDWRLSVSQPLNLTMCIVQHLLFISRDPCSTTSVLITNRSHLRASMPCLCYQLPGPSHQSNPSHCSDPHHPGCFTSSLSASPLPVSNQSHLHLFTQLITHQSIPAVAVVNKDLCTVASRITSFHNDWGSVVRR